VDIILYSIPLFFVLIGLELAVQAWTGRRLFRLADSVADLSCGILSQFAGIATKALLLAVYIWVAERFALQHWTGLPAWPEGSPFATWAGFPGFRVRGAELASWAAVFVLVDLAYYWTHRLSHEVNLLWAGHVVHHSSEEYNLTVALRQSALHGLFTWVFYVPLALLGVPWEMFATSYALNLVYQFWIHTRAVGRMSRWAEAVLNTPSHHRVHHGVDPKYQDRNYAGVFIVWDRLFGTFQPEEEEPVYGITTPLRSWNPLWANVHVFWQILRDAARARTWRERLLYVFGPPGWRPEDEGGRVRPKPVDRDRYQPWDTRVPGGLAAYGFVQFLGALVAAFALLWFAGALPAAELAAGAFYVTVALVGVAGVFESARWAPPIEMARLLTLAGAAVVLGVRGSLPSVAAAGLAVACLASIVWLLRYRNVFVEDEMAPVM